MGVEMGVRRGWFKRDGRGFAGEHFFQGVLRSGAADDDLIGAGFDFQPVAFPQMEFGGDFIGKAEG
jgi:hypothetical protein